MLCGIPVIFSYQTGQPRLHIETAVMAKMFHLSRPSGAG